jgi:cytoskeletal protein RodZ
MINKNHSQKGSAHVVIIVILVIALLGALGFVFWKNFIYKEVETDKNSQQTTDNQSKDQYAGWKTFSSPNDLYSMKYPADWIVNYESNDGPYFRNFDPNSRPAEDPANHKNYPKGYINHRILKTEADDQIFMVSTETEWYTKLGVSTISKGPASYSPNTVTSYNLNGMSAKKTKTVFTETNEDIFLLNGGSL